MKMIKYLKQIKRSFKKSMKFNYITLSSMFPIQTSQNK